MHEPLRWSLLNPDIASELVKLESSTRRVFSESSVRNPEIVSELAESKEHFDGDFDYRDKLALMENQKRQDFQI